MNIQNSSFIKPIDKGQSDLESKSAVSKQDQINEIEIQVQVDDQYMNELKKGDSIISYERDQIQSQQIVEDQLENHIRSRSVYKRKLKLHLLGILIGLLSLTIIILFAYNKTATFIIGAAILILMFGGIALFCNRIYMKKEKLRVDQNIDFRIRSMIIWAKKHMNKISKEQLPMLVEKVRKISFQDNYKNNFRSYKNQSYLSILTMQINFKRLSNSKFPLLYKFLLGQELFFYKKTQSQSQRNKLQFQINSFPLILNNDISKNYYIDLLIYFPIRIINKVFTIYIPILQIDNIVKKKDKKEKHKIITKIQTLIFSYELHSCLNQILAQDSVNDSFEKLNENQIQMMLQKACYEKCYEALYKFEQKIKQCIKISTQKIRSAIQNGPSQNPSIRDRSVSQQEQIEDIIEKEVVSSKQSDLNEENKQNQSNLQNVSSYLSYIECQEEVDQDFQKLREIYEEDLSSWTKAQQTEITTVYKKMEEGSPIVLLRAHAILRNMTIKETLDTMNTIEIRQKWETVLSDFTLIEDNQELGFQVIYFLVKTPFGISNRDFLSVKKIKEDFPKKGMVTQSQRSIEHDSCPPKPRVVRAHSYMSGYLLEEVANNEGSVDTYMTIINKTDIKGMIPKMIVNMKAAKAPVDWINGLIKGYNLYVKNQN